MRNLLLVLFAFAFSPLTVFADVDKFPAGAKYIQELTNNYPESFDRFFSQRNFSVVKSRGEFTNQLGLPWLNRVYMGTKPGQQILARSGIQIKNLEYGKLYSVNGNYVIHVPTAATSGTFFYLMGYDEKQSAEFAKQLNQFYEVAAKDLFIFDFSLLPRAYAADDVACSNPVDPRREVQMQGFVMETMKCIGKGVWSATGEFAVMAWDGAVALWNDPGKVLSQVGDVVAKIPSVVSEAGNVLSQIVDGFTSLPTAEKAKMACEIISSVGTSAAIAFFTAGAGAPSMYAAISKVLLKMGKLANNSRLLRASESVAKRSEEAAKKIALVKGGPDSPLVKAQAEYAGVYGAYAPTNARIQELNKVIYGFPVTKERAIDWAELQARQRMEWGNSYYTRYGRDFIGNAVDPYSKAAHQLRFVRDRFNLTPEQNEKLARLLKTAEDRANPKSDLYREVGIPMGPRIDGKFSSPVTAEQQTRLLQIMSDYDKDYRELLKSIDYKNAIDTKSYQYVSLDKFEEAKKTKDELTASMVSTERLLDEKHRAFSRALTDQQNAAVDNVKGKVKKTIYVGLAGCNATDSATRRNVDPAAATK